MWTKEEQEVRLETASLLNSSIKKKKNKITCLDRRCKTHLQRISRIKTIQTTTIKVHPNNNIAAHQMEGTSKESRTGQIKHRQMLKVLTMEAQQMHNSRSQLRLFSKVKCRVKFKISRWFNRTSFKVLTEVISTLDLCKTKCQTRIKHSQTTLTILVKAKQGHQLEWETNLIISQWTVRCRDQVEGNRTQFQMGEDKPKTLREDRKMDLVHKSWIISLPPSAVMSFEWTIMAILHSTLSCNPIAEPVKMHKLVVYKALLLENLARFAMGPNVTQPLFLVAIISLVLIVLKDATLARYAEHLSRIL